MRYRTWTILVTLIVTVWAAACAPGTGVRSGAQLSPDQQAEQQSMLQLISDETLLGYVKILSSEDFAGRLTGTPEYRAAARWTAARMEEWGLQPCGDNGTFLQAFPNPYNIVFVGGELSTTYRSQGRNRKKTYVYEKDYYPGSMSGNGRLTAEVVYVGYGITAPELDYDDYAGVNVKGKIVLIEPEVPVSSDNPGVFKEWVPYSFHQYKIKMAVAHGAKGLLYNYLTVNPNIDYVRGFMTAQVGDRVVDDVFAGTGKTHEEVLDGIKADLKPASFRSRKRFTIHNITEYHREGMGYNVLGKIEGTEPELRDEVIILGGHLDHVGFCYEVMPGANDNASGVAVMLGVAEALAKGPVKPRRSVLFLALGAEEQALKGSEAYLARPAFPLKKTVIFINMDSVGAGDKLRALAALDFPEVWKHIDAANQRTAGRGIDPLAFPNLGRPRLDAAVFLKKKVPSITFMAYGAPTYAHTTRDVWQNLTPGIMGDLARLLSTAVLDIANSEEDYFPEEEKPAGKKRRR